MMKMPKLQGGADLSVKNRNRPPLRGCVICYSSRLAFSLEPQLAQKSRFPKSFFLSLSQMQIIGELSISISLLLLLLLVCVMKEDVGSCMKGIGQTRPSRVLAYSAWACREREASPGCCSSSDNQQQAGRLFLSIPVACVRADQSSDLMN